MKQKSNWKKLSSRVVYKNPWIIVREDSVIKPDGKEGVYGFVQIPRTIGVVALDDEHNVYLCKQFRYIFQDESWEIPRGFVDEGESAIEAAKRELLEEACVKSQQITSLGKLRLSIGLLDEENEVFLAQHAVAMPGMTHDSKEILAVKKYPFNTVLRWIRESKIKDGLTVAAILKVNDRITNQDNTDSIY